jgi:hypothetical protein
LDIDNTKTVFTILVGIVALVCVFIVVGIVVAIVFGAGAAVGRLF